MSWRKDKRHAPKEKIPERCDPADPVPVAGHVGDAPMLTIDERIRMIVAELVAETPPEGAGDPP